MSTAQVVILAVVVVAVGVAVLLIVRRRRYISDLRGRGWNFESRPELSGVLDHSAPPFGLGFERAVDESITGVSQAGVPFHVFEYTYLGAGPKFDARVASLQLPLALPTLFLSQHGTRFGVDLPGVDGDPACQVYTAVTPLANALLTPAVKAAVNTFGRTAGRLDLSVDGDHLVAVGAPKDPDELAGYLEALAGIVNVLDVAALAPLGLPPAPRSFRFYGRPDWVLVDRDDATLSRYDLTTAGSHHRAEQVIRSPDDGLPLEAFIHRWQTSRTETSTDSEGRTTTRTVTEKHSENVVALWLPFRLPQLSVNGGWGGKRVRFELEQFNDNFAVRTSNPKFASDVLHPRTMEYLLRTQPLGFTIEGELMRFTPSVHDTWVIGRCADFAHELFARVPSFVWDDLGVQPPPFRRQLTESINT